MTFVSLPNDLVIDIMSRVQGKSLARFRSVSKQFRSLLSDPYFHRLHHSRSRNSLFTLVAIKRKGGGYRRQISYEFVVFNKANCRVHEFTEEFRTFRIRMLSSYHQLLCFVCEGGIHLCDPVKKALKNLPEPPYSSWYNFNQSDECCVSFGFVDATMRYKVVRWPLDLDENRTRRLRSGRITTWKKVNRLKFEVLGIDVVDDGRLKVSQWRRRKTPCPYLIQLSSQVHVNGCIYWTTSDFQMVSFSLQDETFSTVNPKPPCFRLESQETIKSRFFTLSGSSEKLWMIDYNALSSIMEIWKMEEDHLSSGCGWTKTHKIDLGRIHPNKNDGRVEMLGIDSNIVLFKLSSTSLLICYNANKNTLTTGVVLHNNQLCQSTDGLLSIHNLDMFKSQPHITDMFLDSLLREVNIGFDI